MNVLNDNDDTVLSTPPPPSTPADATSSQTSCTKIANLNKSANKKKRKLLSSNEAIASAITYFLDGILKVEKVKPKVTERGL